MGYGLAGGGIGPYAYCNCLPKDHRQMAGLRMTVPTQGETYARLMDIFGKLRKRLQ